MGMSWSESNRYGLYPANELAGISPAVLLKASGFGAMQDGTKSFQI
jgi:hypothetical protein